MNKKLYLTILLAVISSYICYNGVWPSDYESKTAAEKLNWMWEKIEADKNGAGLFTHVLARKDFLKKGKFYDMDLTYLKTNKSDQNPTKEKIRTQVGKVAKVQVVFTANEYTGLFQEQSIDGIMRASSQYKPTYEDSSPSLAIKLFRDKVQSANILAMFDSNGQINNVNFFANSLSTHISKIPEFAFGYDYIVTKLLHQKWESVTDWQNMVGTSDVAHYKQDGTKITQPKAPFSLIFEPYSDLTKKCLNYNFDKDTYGCLQRLEPETKMYRIIAVAEPKLRGDIKKEDLKEIGMVVLKSNWTNSKFADTEVTFRHTFWEEEVEVLGKKGTWDNKELIDKAFQRDDGPDKYIKNFPDIQQQAKEI